MQKMYSCSRKHGTGYIANWHDPMSEENRLRSDRSLHLSSLSSCGIDHIDAENRPPDGLDSLHLQNQ